MTRFSGGRCVASPALGVIEDAAIGELDLF